MFRLWGKIRTLYIIFCFFIFGHIYSSLMQMSSPADSHALEFADQKQDADKMRKTQQERDFLEV